MADRPATKPPLTDEQAIRNLEDALIADIMALSDEEVLAEAREDGIDPEAEAARFRAIVEALPHD